MRIPALVIAAAIATIVLTMVLIPILDDAEHPGNTLDVIVIDGQSNAAYYTGTNRVNPNLIDLPIPHNKLMYYGTENAPNDFLTPEDSDGIYEMNRDGRWIIGGIEPTLAYYYSERSGNDVLTINIARGAQSITALSPPDGEYWILGAQAISDALSMVSGYTTVNMIGWVMLQGESDKNMAIDTYKENFLNLADYFDSIGANQCYIVKTRDYYGGNATIAQDQLVQEYDNIHMATTITDTFTEANGDLVNGDPIHYSQRGRNIVGEAVGEYIPVYSPPGSEIISIIPVVIVAAILLAIVGVVGSMILKRD